MTAYGRASLTTALGSFVAEIQSVNRKFLDIHVSLPSELLRFETEIRRLIPQFVSRGQVQLTITAKYNSSIPVTVVPNLPLAKEIKRAWDTIATALDLSEHQSFQLSLLADRTDILLYDTCWEQEEEYKAALLEVTQQALSQYITRKDFEGSSLMKDILQRTQLLQTGIEAIALQSAGAPDKFRKKLTERLQDALPAFIENEERILREICIYAEKVDIMEEITRFKAHITHFEHILNSKEHAIGKTLEFILQEMGREINTIGSKTGEVQVSQKVVEIKSELERIREQIQNVE